MNVFYFANDGHLEFYIGEDEVSVAKADVLTDVRASIIRSIDRSAWKVLHLNDTKNKDVEYFYVLDFDVLFTRRHISKFTVTYN